MPKRPGSKGSRSERKAGRQRAELAKEHGLPVRPPAPARPVVPAIGTEREGNASLRDIRPEAGKSAGIPTLVKVVGAALVILLGVYLLSRHRDAALTDTPASAPQGAAK